VVARIKDLHSSEARLAERGFRGLNYSRYMNPEFDALLDRYLASVPRAERMEALRAVVHHMTDQLNVMTLYYRAFVTMVSNRVVNASADPTSNAHEWEVR